MEPPQLPPAARLPRWLPEVRPRRGGVEKQPPRPRTRRGNVGHAMHAGVRYRDYAGPCGPFCAASRWVCSMVAICCVRICSKSPYQQVRGKALRCDRERLPGRMWGLRAWRCQEGAAHRVLEGSVGRAARQPAEPCAARRDASRRLNGDVSPQCPRSCRRRGTASPGPSCRCTATGSRRSAGGMAEASQQPP